MPEDCWVRQPELRKLSEAIKSEFSPSSENPMAVPSAKGRSFREEAQSVNTHPPRQFIFSSNGRPNNRAEGDGSCIHSQQKQAFRHFLVPSVSRQKIIPVFLRPAFIRPAAIDLETAHWPNNVQNVIAKRASLGLKTIGDEPSSQILPATTDEPLFSRLARVARENSLI